MIKCSDPPTGRKERLNLLLICRRHTLVNGAERIYPFIHEIISEEVVKIQIVSRLRYPKGNAIKVYTFMCSHQIGMRFRE